jgi:hypothetical protein
MLPPKPPAALDMGQMLTSELRHGRTVRRVWDNGGFGYILGQSGLNQWSFLR